MFNNNLLILASVIPLMVIKPRKRFILMHKLVG